MTKKYTSEEHIAIYNFFKQMLKVNGKDYIDAFKFLFSEQLPADLINSIIKDALKEIDEEDFHMPK